MKKLTITALIVAGLFLSGCETPSGRPYRAGTGALIGAGLGATVGSLSSHHHRTGAVIGALGGALAGGLIGQSMDINAAERERLQAQAPDTYQRIQETAPLELSDIKALAAAGVSDDVIISQIRNSRTVYHLSTADILDLKDAGVSERVIDYMINTASTADAYVPPQVSVSPPPVVQQEVYVASVPGPDYVWIDGAWSWGGFNWVWIGGHYAHRPFPHARWVPGRRDHYRGRSHWTPGHWR